MVVQFYDKSIYATSQQKKRLEAAICLSSKSMPSIVWAEDALAFVHTVPTGLFMLQLLVPDHLVDEAAVAICRGSPYRPLSDPPGSTREHPMIDPDQPTRFPQSLFLDLEQPRDGVTVHEYTPTSIAIHPASYFQLDIADLTRSIALEGVPTDIRCPTRTAFLDSLITTILDPPLGYVHRNLHSSLVVHLSYITLYTLRNQPRILEDGQLEPECRSLIESLKEENRQYLERFLLGIKEDWGFDATKRREVLHKLGCASFGLTS